MHRGWFILVLAFVITVPWSADAVEKVAEPATGIEFEASLDGGYELLGLGVRKKLTFKIYATALYVKVPDAVEPLRTAKHPFGPIIKGTFARKMVLHFVRSVPGDKAKDAFRKNFDRVMVPEDQEKCVEDRKRYLEAMGGDIAKGERYTMDFADGRIRVYLGQKQVYETSNPIMIQGIFRIWYGPKPLSETLKKSLVSRLQNIID